MSMSALVSSILEYKLILAWFINQMASFIEDQLQSEQYVKNTEVEQDIKEQEKRLLVSVLNEVTGQLDKTNNTLERSLLPQNTQANEC